jgi:hypothetical protein
MNDDWKFTVPIYNKSQWIGGKQTFRKLSLCANYDVYHFVIIDLNYNIVNM